MTDKKTHKLGLLAPRGVDPHALPKFSGYVEVDAHYIFHPNTIWVRPLCTELGPNPPPKKAHFAMKMMKQTNIGLCRLSGDIITYNSLYNYGHGSECPDNRSVLRHLIGMGLHGSNVSRACFCGTVDRNVLSPNFRSVW